MLTFIQAWLSRVTAVVMLWSLLVSPVPTIWIAVPPAVVPDGIPAVLPKPEVMDVMVGWGNVLVLVVAV